MSTIAQVPSRPLWLPALSLAKRELVRFLRQRNRIIGALATPIVFWLLIGAGMGRSFQGAPGGGGDGNYLRYFYPGTVLMILLFTAIFSTISIIEDRREGFLQSVLVAPISPMVIVLGKVLGGTALAFGQGLIFLVLAPLVGFSFTPISFLLALFVMFVVAFALTALGFCIAWRMSSTQGFHAIMNLFLMPMWFLSGALFPASGAMAGLQWVIRLNPLSYGLSALRQTMQWHAPLSGSVASFSVCVIVSVVFALVLFFLASVIATGRTSADLQ
ncbi:MAG: multidrug efflux pump, inner rane subunit [Phycisphaerales bacterium]|nr:multidrug efflux pump, inner rane subunit [Phycisphaerales bacterium]